MAGLMIGFVMFHAANIWRNESLGPKNGSNELVYEWCLYNAYPDVRLGESQVGVAKLACDGVWSGKCLDLRRLLMQLDCRRSSGKRNKVAGSLTVSRILEACQVL